MFRNFLNSYFKWPKAFHYNGIICLVDYKTIALSNPSLAEYFKTFVSQSDFEMDDNLIKGMDLVVILLVRMLSNDDGDDLRAKVYNFGVDHSWREITFPTLQPCILTKEVVIA